MTGALDRLSMDYRAAFLAFLHHHDEETLHRAYELGRVALADGVSLLDLVRTHHFAFGEVLDRYSAPSELADMINAAATFLVEALAPFEMARQAYLENAAKILPTSSATGLE